MATPLPTSARRPPHARWGLLLLVALFGCLAGPRSPEDQADSIVRLHLPSLNVGALTLNHIGLGNAALAAVLAHPSVHALTDVGLADNALDAEAVALLLASPKTSGLTTLDLGGNPIGDDGMRTLAGSAQLPQLDSVRLDRVGAGPNGVAALAGLTGSIVLRQVDLAGNPLRDGGAVAMAGFPIAVSLSLEDAQIGPAGARAVVSGARCPRVTLSGNPVGSGGLHGLTQISAELVELSMERALLGPMDALTLADLPAPGLRRLSLRANSLGSEGARELAHAPWFSTIEALDVRDVGADSATAAALTAAWGDRPGLAIGG